MEHRGRQESLQKSSLGKISVSFRGKEKWKYWLFFGGAFVLSASELMKCSSDYVVHNHFVIVAVSDSIHSSFPVECFLYILPLKNLQLKTFFLSWRTFLVGKYGIQSTNQMAFKRTVPLREFFRFPAIRFEAPTLLTFSRCTHAPAKCPPVVIQCLNCPASLQAPHSNDL